jgi:hypothetical protein
MSPTRDSTLHDPKATSPIFSASLLTFNGRWTNAPPSEMRLNGG